jgi:Meiotically up-regulated gene 113
MDREHIISEIKRTSEKNGGTPLGEERFFQETGIRKYDWYGKIWTKWNDALSEAGYGPNHFNQALSDDFLLDKFTGLIRELNRFPTSGDLRLKSNKDSSFPSHNTFDRFGKKHLKVERVRAYCIANNLEELLSLLPTSKLEREDENDLTGESIVFGTVYLYKSQSYFKIGRTNDVKRRNREIKLQLPFEAQLIHTISTDDPIGIEAYWHQRFNSKRLNGEWFKLSKSDIIAFKRRKFM